ncbi:hypothetical protein [Candidatus Nitrotoga sp. M5]|uniref:hypothetical protein n=1 Tax=Candidatus Nitrotoga sp. M5 TaxID=2890409 RepID=UPI001EF6FB7F|nr:hypothetical protein [Candidatus Nitrotoga sp. M5]CAH1388032.1 conserved hypothetical protein [Candidatus Nitrotoga sp. M5]
MCVKDKMKKKYKLPHERDQTTDPDGTGSGPQNDESQKVLDQALTDIIRGIKDTDLGTPSDVPTEKNKKE